MKPHGVVDSGRFIAPFVARWSALGTPINERMPFARSIRSRRKPLQLHS
jgi:hypothetical protein